MLGVSALQPSTVIVPAGLNDVCYAVDWYPNKRLHWTTRTYELGLPVRNVLEVRRLNAARLEAIPRTRHAAASW
jgi:D-serine deaminase-like pyridoxal phosphate-dependent protein